MPKRALIEKRPILLASLAASLAFFVLRQSPVVPELFPVPLKGAAVGLLALYAWMRAGGGGGKLLAGALVLGALGDMAMEADRGLGAILFLAYHAVAIALYLRHPREAATGSQRALAVTMLVLTPLVFWLLPADRSEAAPTAIYGLALGGMAACAWMSAFSRYRVGVGAVLFLVSDVLIVAGAGPLMGADWPHWLIWPLYYIGQLLICLGVIQRLRHADQAASLAA